jgi:hypothetical protein
MAAGDLRDVVQQYLADQGLRAFVEVFPARDTGDRKFKVSIDGPIESLIQSILRNSGPTTRTSEMRRERKQDARGKYRTCKLVLAHSGIYYSYLRMKELLSVTHPQVLPVRHIRYSPTVSLR